MQFHTDLRSQKVDILKKNKNASLVFYDKEEKIQLRVKVICEINNQNNITKEAWEKTQHISRRCYLVDGGPGIVSKGPTSGMISKLEDFDYTMEQSERVIKILPLLSVKLNQLSGYI